MIAQCPPPRAARGFTLIELMIVVAIMGLMATFAIPSYQDRIIRAEVSEGIALADFARQAVSDYYRKNHRMPADNAAAGLPPPDRIVGTYVSQMTVKGGAVVITFGSRANHFLATKTLSMRPAVVDGFPQVPLSWVCGQAPTPEKMTVTGIDETTVVASQLPLDCRS